MILTERGSCAKPLHRHGDCPLSSPCYVGALASRMEALPARHAQVAIFLLGFGRGKQPGCGLLLQQLEGGYEQQPLVNRFETERNTLACRLESGENYTPAPPTTCCRRGRDCFFKELRAARWSVRECGPLFLPGCGAVGGEYRSIGLAEENGGSALGGEGEAHGCVRDGVLDGDGLVIQ